MKKIAVALLSLTLISNAACADSSDVVATYSGGKVTSTEVMKHFQHILDKQKETMDKKFSDLDKQMQESLVRSFINVQLMNKEAEKLGIADSDSFKEKLKTAKNYMMQQELFELKTKDVMSQEAVDQEYKKLVKALKGQKEVKVSHILLDSEENAKEAKSKVIKSGNFEKVAKELSKDESSKVQGGSLGYITKGRLVPEFEEKAFSMKKNEVSNPVKTQFGWHIIKVHDIRDRQVPKQEQIENELKGKLANDAIKKYIEELEKNAKIELKI